MSKNSNSPKFYDGISPTDNIRRISELLDDKYDSYKYGYTTNTKKILLRRDAESEFWEEAYDNYIIPSTEQFERRKVGMCFDVVESISKLFDKQNIPYRKWFTCLPEGTHPHCVITFDMDGYTVKADFTPKLDARWDGNRIKVFNNIDEFKDARTKKGKLIFEYTDRKLEGIKLSSLIDVLTNFKVHDNNLSESIMFAPDIYLNESLLTHDDVIVNLDKWVDGSILYVTGESGGGKSTIAKKYVEENNAVLMPLDIFFMALKRSKQEALDKVDAFISKGKMTNDKHLVYALKKYITEIPDAHFNALDRSKNKLWGNMDDINNIMYHGYTFCHYCDGKLDPHKKYVFEGAHIWLDPDIEFYTDKPLIIKGTGYIKSSFRALRRDWTNDAKKNAARFTQRILKMFSKNNSLWAQSIVGNNFRKKILSLSEGKVYSDEDIENMVNSGKFTKAQIEKIKEKNNIAKAKAKEEQERQKLMQQAHEDDMKKKKESDELEKRKNDEKDVLSDTEYEEKYGERMYEDVNRELMDKYGFTDGIRKDYDSVDNPDIKKIIDMVKDIEYGYIDINDKHRETNREYIHSFAKRNDDHLLNHYALQRNPILTIYNKIGICGDQTIAIKHLINNALDGYKCNGYALRKGRFGHAVPGFRTKDGEWYYLENAWDKERGLHGPFASENELMKYFEYLYHKHHDKDNDDPVTVTVWDCMFAEAIYNEYYGKEILNEEQEIYVSMSERKKKNEEYIKQHVANVQKGFNWIKENCPEMLAKCNLEKVEQHIKEHDASKWSKEEFEPYANRFFGERTPEVEEVFEKAWQHHWQNNPHHPEYWNGRPMPEDYIIEMICDWWAFSWKEGKLDEIFEFQKEAEPREKFTFNPETKHRVDELLHMLKRKLTDMDLI